MINTMNVVVHKSGGGERDVFGVYMFYCLVLFRGEL
jgi:hypothetical protein